MLLRSIVFLIAFTLFHGALEHAQANTAMDGVVFGWILACVDLPRTMLAWAMGPHFMAMHQQSMALAPTFGWLMFWMWLNYDPDFPRVTLYHEQNAIPPHALSGRLDVGFRWRNALGLFVLSDVEQDLFTRVHAAMPERMRQPFLDQQRRFTRSQRLYLNPERTRAITTFQSVRFLALTGRFPQRLPMLDEVDEFALVSCTVLTPKHSVLVEMFVRDGVLVRLEYTSDYDLDRFPRPYTITDVRLDAEVMPRADSRLRRRNPMDQVAGR